MTLKKYQEKRSSKTSPEPFTSHVSTPAKNPPLFCIQKHDASHLHYDFRIECQGVMLSWAIPKGPSLDPLQKRLAIHVEDHPLEYRHFEGVIPSGNYGAGTVMIWDEGFYTSGEAQSKKEIEKAIIQGLEKGHVDLNLHGEKLHGHFALQLLNKENNQWLLIKKKDSYANSKEDVLLQDRSVRTQRSLDEIAYGRESPQKNIPKFTKKKSSKQPVFIKPMLASLISHPFDDENWLFEIKWDGYRALANIDKKVELFSRNEKSFNQQFSPIVEDLSHLKEQAILDGEIVILDSNGRSNFQLMQNYQTTHRGELYYYVFDLLYLNGHDLRDRPLIERKEILKNLMDQTSFKYVRYSDHIMTKGEKLFEEARKQRLEGIMAKKIESLYVSKRSHDWLKIKTHQRQEVIIGGYTQPRGGRKHFGALLLGVYNEKKEFIYVGHVGGGFDQKLLEKIFLQLHSLEQKKCPFQTIPKTNTHPTWVKPKLVCEVSFAEWTTDGRLRQPIFEGMREDKKANLIKREAPIKEIKEVIQEKVVSITHADKLYWPRLKLTKGDLVHYYQAVVEAILPYLKNRPMMLKRYPEGITGQAFVQKDSRNLHLPSWLQTVDIVHSHKKISYFLIQDLESLEFVVNLGTIEMHPFLSQINNPEYPDYFVIDLDPEDIHFSSVIEVAQVLHKILEELNIPSFCKTSGKRGLHICIPMNQKYTFEEALRFGQIIVQYAHSQIPQITSLERQPAKRQKKVYLDVLQNHYKQTVIAPYSARGTEYATVSTPLKWTEVKKGLDPQNYTIQNVPKRLKKTGDLFLPVLGKGVDIRASLKKLQRKLGNQDE